MFELQLFRILLDICIYGLAEDLVYSCQIGKVWMASVPSLVNALNMYHFSISGFVQLAPIMRPTPYLLLLTKSWLVNDFGSLIYL